MLSEVGRVKIYLIESLNARVHVQCFVQGWPVHIRLPGSARVEDDSIRISAPRGQAWAGGFDGKACCFAGFLACLSEARCFTEVLERGRTDMD